MNMPNMSNTAKKLWGIKDPPPVPVEAKLLMNREARKFWDIAGPPPPSVMDVICNSCRRVFYETNERYDPGRVTNPTMLTMKEPYNREYGWEQLPPDDSVIFDSLMCPGCDAPMGDADGKVITVERKPIPEPVTLKSVTEIVREKTEEPEEGDGSYIKGIYLIPPNDDFTHVYCTICHKTIPKLSRGGHHGIHRRAGEIPGY